ncbi:hypothetical protein ONZ51_g6265 [Trametes cubensis]|uniref:Uncharacterized protein n=1 Tax=Trametes cubensis TaxID=1111947 RepID=A0AAD7TSH4_9APHY|nr:hypothetical protein ONZ51_g6265 [Trametes cubensis]
MRQKNIVQDSGDIPDAMNMQYAEHCLREAIEDIIPAVRNVKSPQASNLHVAQMAPNANDRDDAMARVSDLKDRVQA